MNFFEAEPDGLCSGFAIALAAKETLGLYEVSNAGNVRRADNHRPKAATVHVDGYLVVRLWNEGMSTSAYIHRLVAQAFIGDCPEGYEVGSKNTDRTDNCIKNLNISVPQSGQSGLISRD
jgi:hypothetical protein